MLCLLLQRHPERQQTSSIRDWTRKCQQGFDRKHTIPEIHTLYYDHARLSLLLVPSRVRFPTLAVGGFHHTNVHPKHWEHVEASKAEMVRRQAIHAHGIRANMSAHGPVNLRGNIIEAITTNLQAAGSSNIRVWLRYDPVFYWYEWPRQQTDRDRWWPQNEPGKRSSSGTWSTR